MTGGRRLLLVTGILAAGWWVPPGSSKAADLDAASRWTALALLEEDFDQVAEGLLAGILAKDPRFAFDRINLARCRLKLRKDDQVLPLLEEAERLDPAYPHIAYFRGIAHRRRGEYAGARSAFQAALQRVPTAVEPWFQLGLVEDQEGHPDRARPAFERMLQALDGARGRALSWTLDRRARYLAHKHLSLIHQMAGEDAQAEAHQQAAFAVAGSATPGDDDLDLAPGLPVLHPQERRVREELERAGVTIGAPVEPAKLRMEEGPAGFAPDGGFRSALLVDASTGTVSVWAVETDRGTVLRELGGSGTRQETVWSGVRVVAAGDLDGAGGADLVGVSREGRFVVRARPGTSTREVEPGTLAGPGPAVLADLDHDGDLDVVIGGRQGGACRIEAIQNRTPPGPAGSLALKALSSTECGVTTGVPSSVLGLEAGDLDDDGSTDVVAFLDGGPPRVFLDRGQGRFDAGSLAGPPGTGAGDLADLDGDGALDLAYPVGAGVHVLVSGAAGDTGPDRVLGLSFTGQTVPLPPDVPGRSGRPEVIACDLDGNGRLDLVHMAGSGETRALLNRSGPGSPGFESHGLPGRGVPGDSWPGMMAEDLDRDGDLDLVLPGGRVLFNRTVPVPGFLRVSLRGTARKTPSAGIGSVIQVRAGGRLLRREARRSVETIPIGFASRADLVRVRWTDGTVQNQLGPAADPPERRTVVPAGSGLVINQKGGLGGSCPYLYRKVGDRWEFVTDVLADSPLGLPSSRGGVLPPRPRELFVLPGDTPGAPGSTVSLRITEEYREVTFLDRAELRVIDLAPGQVVVPRGGIGSDLEPGLVVLDRVLPLRSARTLDGHDVTREVAASDGITTVPPRGPVQGLAPENGLLLDPDPPPAGSRIWLVLEGLVYWTDAGINTALAQADPRALRPPLLEVAPAAGPGGRPGPFRTVLDPLPFPAGRTKVAAVEISRFLGPGPALLRIRSTMRIFWDRISLGSVTHAITAVGGVALPAREARLVPVPLSRLGPDPGEPPWRVDPGMPADPLETRWIVPRGWYTRFGPVRALVGAFDDLYAVLGPGDGVELTFGPLPARVPGSVRWLVLDVAGYCKDAHPATHASRTVEPYPYRGMPVYGPGVTPDPVIQERIRRALFPWSSRARE